MSDLISRKKVIDILEKEKSLRCGYDADISIFSIEKGVRELPTAYDIDKVVEELEQKKEEVQRMMNTCVALSDLEACDIENVTYEGAIEIVKHGCVDDDVCEWKQDNMCETVYRVCGGCFTSAYQKDFKYCPYCGKKIKVVE